jgi:hypothetical protein
MIRKFSLLTALVFCLNVHAMAKILYFVKNNQELTIPSEKEFSDIEIKIQNILRQYHGNQSLIVRVQFVDEQDADILNSLMLWLGLAQQEQPVDKDVCQDIEIIFVRKGDAWSYKETQFSKNDFTEKYFLPKVIEFVNEVALENLTSEREIIRKWLVVISNVLNQQWKDKVLSEGASLINVQGYVRGHRLAHWMQPDYMYDLEPHTADSASASKVTYISNAKTNNKDYKEYEFMPTLVRWFTDFEYHNPYKTISEVENKLFEGVRSREDYSNKKPNHDLVTTKILSDTSFHRRDRDKKTKLYRLKLVEIPIGDNEEYNLFSDLARFGWRHTSCNFFAFDLQKKVFGRYLWPLSCAFSSTAISEYLPTDPNFMKINNEDAAEYSEAGYFVIVVKAGHVTTMFPDKIRNGDYGHVVQAGSYVGNKIFLNNVWGSKKELNEADSYVYFGNILF